MSIAFAYAFQSISSLVDSYENPVRSVEYKVVTEYLPSVILIYPEDSDTFLGCEMIFNVKPRGDINHQKNCTIQNFTFFSYRYNKSRNVFAFKGPIDVYNGERLKVIFRLNLTVREESSNLEYRLFSDWYTFERLQEYKSVNEIADEVEINNPINQLAGGYSNFISLDKTVAHKLNGDNVVEYIQTSHIAPLIKDYNISQLVAYFEWADPILETSLELISTTVWNSLGSLFAIFLAIGKFTDYGKYWIHKLQRTRRRHIHYKMIMNERNSLINSINRTDLN